MRNNMQMGGPPRQEQAPNFNGYLYQVVILLIYIMSLWIETTHSDKPLFAQLQALIFGYFKAFSGIVIPPTITAPDALMSLNGLLMMMNIYPKGKDPGSLTKDINLFALLVGAHILLWFVLKNIQWELLIATVAMLIALYVKVRINLQFAQNNRFF